MRTRYDRLSTQDRNNLWSEAPSTPMHVIAVLQLEPERFFDACGHLKLADRLQAVAENAAHRSLIADAGALRESGTLVVLIEPGPEDLAAMGLNLMNRKRAHFAFEAAVRTVANQLRSGHIGERLESPTGPAGSIRAC